MEINNQFSHRPSGRRVPVVGEAGYERVPAEAYFTLDADWIVPALLKNVALRGPILEPCAGRGHLVKALRDAGHDVAGRDLHAYHDPVADDLLTNRDMMELTVGDLVHFGSVVANFPYDEVPLHTERLLKMLEAHRGQLASLVRAEWLSAKSRCPLLRDHPACDMVIFLTRRPRWVPRHRGDASPRHNFCWVVWDWTRDRRLDVSVRWAP